MKICLSKVTRPRKVGKQTSERVGQYDACLRGVDGVPEAAAKKSDPKNDHIAEEIETKRKPSLHHDSHKRSTVLHVKTSFCVSHAMDLMVDESSSICRANVPTCSLYARIVATPVKVSENN